jgi:hypothetical protein
MLPQPRISAASRSWIDATNPVYVRTTLIVQHDANDLAEIRCWRALKLLVMISGPPPLAEHATDVKPISTGQWNAQKEESHGRNENEQPRCPEVAAAA